MNKVSPTVGHWQLFQNKITNAQQMPGGRWACLQLTEPFSVKLPLISGLVLLFLQKVLYFGHYFHKSKPLAY